MSEALNTDDYMYPITQSEEYIAFKDTSEQLGNDQSAPERERAHDHAVTIGALALAHAEMDDRGHLSPEGTMFNLIGHMESFSHAQNVLDLRRDRLPREQRNRYKRDVIEFNHALKAAIAQNPQTGMTGMLQTMSRSYAQAYGSKNVQVFMGQARTALVGMQHELAGEQIIDATSGYEVARDRIVTVDDELGGIDVYVRNLATSEVFGIDLKASEAAVHKSRLGSDHADSIVFSQCKNSELEDTFRLAPTLARRKSHSMKYALDRAAHSQRAHALAA